MRLAAVATETKMFPVFVVHRCACAYVYTVHCTCGARVCACVSVVRVCISNAAAATKNREDEEENTKTEYVNNESIHKMCTLTIICAWQHGKGKALISKN